MDAGKGNNCQTIINSIVIFAEFYKFMISYPLTRRLGVDPFPKILNFGFPPSPLKFFNTLRGGQGSQGIETLKNI